MINIYCFEPSLTKTKMYSWSPFCVTVRIYQTPVGRIEASRINRVSNEPETKGAVKLLSVEGKKLIGDIHLALNHSHVRWLERKCCNKTG